MIECRFTPQGGQTFQVKNITSVTLSEHRPPAENGHVGMKGHTLGSIEFSRRRSLQEGGSAGLEDEIIKLAAATEKKAYFSGEVTFARSDDTSNKVITIRWKEGHICNHGLILNDVELYENFSVSVTEMSINDSTFNRTLTT